MYQVVTPDYKMMSAYQNVLYGKPDCWDLVSSEYTLEAAEEVASKIDGRVRIRLADDINPNRTISDKYHIDPKREPELADRIAQEYSERGY